jgi:hypothetical protein
VVHFHSFPFSRSRRRLSFRPSCRMRSLARIRERGGASNALGWPDRRSGDPSATKKKMSRLLRRQVLRTFEHMLDLNRPSRPLVRPPALNAKRPLPSSLGQVGQAGLCGRLRSRLSAKLRHIGRRRRELVFFAAEGCRDPYRASQKCSQRRPVPGFEPGTLFGAKIATTKILFQTDLLPMFDYVCTLIKRYTNDER